MANVLEISGLRKRFGSKQVLEDVTLTVPENCVFGFVGRNGAGKTTTMKSVVGLLKPDGGEVDVCGEKVSFGGANTNRFIGYLPDVPEFYGFMTAREYLSLCGKIAGMKSSEIKAIPSGMETPQAASSLLIRSSDLSLRFRLLL